MKQLKFKINNSGIRYCLLFAYVFFSVHLQASNNATLIQNNQSSVTSFALEEVKAALTKLGRASIDQPIQSFFEVKSGEFKFLFLDFNNIVHQKIIKSKKIARTTELKKEGFLIHRATKNDKTIYIIGYDEAGLMYGGLEVAEIIKTQGIAAVQSQLQNAYMKVRGIKFNIPLDMRSPTYTEPSDAAQKNKDEMWDFEFWKDYIDNLARYRSNLISLWNMHPFPSMVI